MSSQLGILDRQNVLVPRGEISKPLADLPVERQIPESLIAKHGRTLSTTLQNIFPEKQEETRIQKARLIMGDDIKDLSDEDLEVYLTEFQYLIDSWLDEYEKQVFSNKTLKETLMEV